MYFSPENSGGTDCLIPVPQEKIDKNEVGMSGYRGRECISGVFWTFNEDWGYPVSYCIWWGSHSVLILNRSSRCLTFHLSNFNTAYIIAFSKH